MSRPPTCTEPAVGGTSPASTRMVVDLPAPLRPSSAVAWPACAWTSMPATASTSPKRTWRPRMSTTGSLTRKILPARPDSVSGLAKPSRATGPADPVGGGPPSRRRRLEGFAHPQPGRTGGNVRVPRGTSKHGLPVRSQTTSAPGSGARRGSGSKPLPRATLPRTSPPSGGGSSAGSRASDRGRQAHHADPGAAVAGDHVVDDPHVVPATLAMPMPPGSCPRKSLGDRVGPVVARQDVAPHEHVLGDLDGAQRRDLHQGAESVVGGHVVLDDDTAWRARPRGRWCSRAPRCGPRARRCTGRHRPRSRRSPIRSCGRPGRASSAPGTTRTAGCRRTACR